MIPRIKTQDAINDSGYDYWRASRYTADTFEDQLRRPSITTLSDDKGIENKFQQFQKHIWHVFEKIPLPSSTLDCGIKLDKDKYMMFT